MPDSKIKLLGFQEEGVRKALKRQRGLLFLCPMGAGKTLMALATAWRRFKRGQIDRVIVVCQLTLADQWREAILHWLPEADVIYNPLTPNNQRRLAFYVVHYENIRNQQLRRFYKYQFDMMIVDESQKIKNRDSKQSRRLWHIRKNYHYALALTGTPMESNEIDFWSQCRVVDDSVFGGNWTIFKEDWTQPAGFMGKKPILIPERRKKFLRMVHDMSYSVSDEEALGLPEIMDIHLPVILRGKQRTSYEQMEQDLILTLPELEIMAPRTVTQMIRLQQIVGGFIPDESGRHFPLGAVKLAAVRDFLDSQDEPVVIYSRFLWEIDAIAKATRKAGRKPSVITGEQRIGTHTKFDVLVCQIGIVAGLDGMQHVSSTGLFYSKTFSHIQYQQARSRLRRRGQTKRVRFYHLTAKSTIDIDIDDALSVKGDVEKSVVKFLLARRSADGEGRTED